MLAKSFSYNGAEITIRRATVRARLKEHFVYRAFDINENSDENALLELQTFANFMTLAEVKGDLGFPIPALTDPKEQILAAFEAFMNLDAAFYDTFLVIVREVNAPAAETDVTPEVLQKKA